MICIYHSRDLDGWMSAAIVKKFVDEDRFCSVCNHKLPKDWSGSTPCCGGIASSEHLELIGWDYGNAIPNIPEGEQVVMVDISFPSDVMLKLHRENALIWIDHHASAIRDNTEINVNRVIYIGSTDPKFAACELTWNYFFSNEPMPELVRLLGRYDCFGHKGTSEEQKVLEFQYGARAYLHDVDTCLTALKSNFDRENMYPSWTGVDFILSAGGSIYKYLCTEAVMDYKSIFPVMIAQHRIAAINKQRFNPINFGIDYHKDGYDAFMCFWYVNGKWNFSLYNDNGKVDCSLICKQFGGGGHAGASGFISDNIDFLLNTVIKL